MLSSRILTQSNLNVRVIKKKKTINSIILYDPISVLNNHILIECINFLTNKRFKMLIFFLLNFT